jgi:hypothetical protein
MLHNMKIIYIMPYYLILFGSNETISCVKGLLGNMQKKKKKKKLRNWALKSEIGLPPNQSSIASMDQNSEVCLLFSLFSFSHSNPFCSTLTNVRTQTLPYARATPNPPIILASTLRNPAN